jgi:hypothetical protein
MRFTAAAGTPELLKTDWLSPSCISIGSWSMNNTMKTFSGTEMGDSKARIWSIKKDGR